MHSWRVGKLVVHRGVDSPWRVNDGGRRWNQVEDGLEDHSRVPRFCLLGHGEPLKMSE